MNKDQLFVAAARDGEAGLKMGQRGRILRSVHKTAEGLAGTGVMSKETMREFDELCPDAGAAAEPRGNSGAAGEGRGEPGHIRLVI